MQADDYQESLQKFIIYGENAKVIYPLLGLIGEVGELVEKLLEGYEPENFDNKFSSEVMALLDTYKNLSLRIGKTAKQVRDNGEEVDQEFVSNILFSNKEKRQEYKKEMGDIQFMVAQLAHEIGFLLSEVMQKNYDKLFSRFQRNVISGSGDNR